MRRSLPLLVLLLTTAAACSQASEDSGSTTPTGSADSTGRTGQASNSAADLSAGDVALNPAEPGPTPTELPPPVGQPTRESGPDVGPGSAPGVAFDYRYSFRLAADKVSQAQQEHQRLCERYGLTRCRITGMTYRAASADDVEATLAFQVDPAIAGQFSRESVQAVTAADGQLTESQINGADVGTSIQQAGRSITQIQADIARLEERLRARDINEYDKGQLEAEANELRGQLRDLRENRAADQHALTTTPIQFRYGSGNLAPGPAQPTTLREALGDTGGDLMHSATVLLVILVRLFPWLLAGLLSWAAFVVIRRRLNRAPPAEAAVETAPAA
jgi:Domain of unknown function (DUF4349)